MSKPIGLDIGYSSTKSVHDGGSFRVPSVVGTFEEWFSVWEQKETVEFDGEKFLVGNTAVAQSIIVERREDRGWIKSDMYEKLLKYALVRSALECKGTDLFVVSGLPLSYFLKDALTLKEILVGRHSAKINDQFCEVNVVDARIIPQPFGALLDYALNDVGGILPERAEGRVGVIDIGGKTTNILSVEDLAENSREATSVNVGGWTAVRRLTDYLLDRYPDIDDRASNIEKVLVDKQFVYFGEDVPVSKIIEEISDSIASQINAELSQRWGSASHFKKIIVSGGGAHLIGDTMLKVFPQAILHPNPVFANANGFFKFAKRSS